MPTYSDAQIEVEAKRLCIALGLDPLAESGHGFGADFTAAEWAAYNCASVPAILLYSPLWRLWRGKAAVSLAMRDVPIE